MSLAFGALGVVFGDIGTSPLYTLRGCMKAVAESGPVTTDDLFGVLSLIFWSMTLVVTVKYLGFIMRADNHGEGGVFALLAILPPELRVHPFTPAESRPKRAGTVGLKGLTWISTLVVIGAAMLYGDGAITPAISVLSAIEGLTVAQPSLEPLVLPVTCGIIAGIFFLQHRGTGTVGRLFGPVMLIWFLTIACLGIHHIFQRPDVLRALWHGYAFTFFGRHGFHGFLVLGSVVLAVTGGEALYADMGHFGAKPIRWAWLTFVTPALVLCYFGQGALILRDPSAMAQPFFALVPEGPATWAMIGLASLATIIASQALISGAFSLTRQAMQLGYFPRMTIKHTAFTMEGQIYVPEINWILAFTCMLLVLGFRSSDALAAAYGVAVTGTMTITSIVYYVVLRQVFNWGVWSSRILLVFFLASDLPFLFANAFKIADGGWVPMLIGVAIVASMLIWSKGRSQLVREYMSRFPSYEQALPMIERELYTRVPGAAVFMASSAAHMPPSLMHFVRRVRVLPETIVLLTVLTDTVPSVPPSRRYSVQTLGHGMHRLFVHFGFMDTQSIPAVLAQAAAEQGLPVDPAQVTYYLGRDSFVTNADNPFERIAEVFFAFLSRNAVTADRHFHIPTQQVVEIGLQTDL